MVRRGTTPTLALLVKHHDLSGCAIFVTVRQKSNISTKTGDDIMMAYEEEEGTMLTVTLTQEETLALGEGTANVQVRWINSEGVAKATNVEMLDIKKILLEEVISFG